MSDQKPSVGRMVHYRSFGTPGGEHESACRAAIVTEVGPYYEPSGGYIVGLAVLNPNGMYFDGDIEYHAGDRTSYAKAGDTEPALWYPGGTWHWPERV